MPSSKIADEVEALRWVSSEVTHAQMVERYREKYEIEITYAMWSSLRRRRGLVGRKVHDEVLVPWTVKAEHRRHYDVVMLRTEARLRAGEELSREERQRLQTWKYRLVEAEEVIVYDPETPTGFSRVPRHEDEYEFVRGPAEHARMLAAAGDDAAGSPSVAV